MNKFKYSLISLAMILGGCGGSDSSTTLSFSQHSYELTVLEDDVSEITVSALDGDGELTYSLLNSAANGEVSVDAQSGEINYQPNANFNGTDLFVVAVSDSESTANATVNVSVTPENDAPEITLNDVIVSGGEVKKGQISATDIDGDSITYTITAQPVNGTLTVDAESGEVSYQPDDLSLVNDTFELTVTDESGASDTQTMTLTATTSSNIDRAYYYYASEQSHLNRAEQINTLLTDDESQSLINANVIRGYAKAGFIGEVNSRLNSVTIVSDAERAMAMVDVANSYQQSGLIDKAQDLRSESNTLYTQYVASKGLSAFSSEDVSFYNALAASYRSAGDFASANQAYSILDLLFISLAEDGYSTSILRTFFGFRNIVEDTIEQWQLSGDDALYDLALTQAQRLQTYANEIPAQEVMNDRYGNEGEFTYKVRQVALFDVISSYIELNKLAAAKSAMADVFALHGVVNYDENYPRELDEYWQVTREEYEYGLVGATVSYVNLYPGEGVEPILSGISETSFWSSSVEEDAVDALLLAQVRNMADKDAALQLIIDAKDENNLRNYFTTLVAFNTSNLGASYILRKQGQYEAALKYLTEGLAVLTSSQYFEQELNVTLNLGSTGCEMLIDEALLIASLSQLTSASDFAQTAVEQCADMAQGRYANGNDASEITVGDAIRANAYMLQYSDVLDLSGKQSGLIEIINSNFSKISDDHGQNYTLKSFVGWQLARGGQFTLAQSYYTDAISALNTLETEAIDEEVGELTEDFYSDSRREGDYAEFLTIIENNAGQNGYAAAIEIARSAWKEVLDTRITELSDGNVLQKAEFLPEYASQLSRLGEFEQALSLAEDSALGPVEVNGIRTEVASRLSIKDDFPNSLIATVDTDVDGLPNFFAPGVTQEQIDASGLVLDEDSDNDGTIDSEDAYPLDSEQQ